MFKKLLIVFSLMFSFAFPVHASEDCFDYYIFAQLVQDAHESGFIVDEQFGAWFNYRELYVSQIIAEYRFTRLDYGDDVLRNFADLVLNNCEMGDYQAEIDNMKKFGE